MGQRIVCPRPVGWVLREVGKRHPPGAENFLRAHHRAMPRATLRYAIEMLRYAIEKFPEAQRRQYLKG